MKNELKKRQHIGFVAQDVKEAIPEEFENVVNEDNEYMSINMVVCVPSCGRATKSKWIE